MKNIFLFSLAKVVGVTVYILTLEAFTLWDLWGVAFTAALFVIIGVFEAKLDVEPRHASFVAIGISFLNPLMYGISHGGEIQFPYIVQAPIALLLLLIPEGIAYLISKRIFH